MFTIEDGTINLIRAEGVPCGKMIVFIAMRGAAAICQRARSSQRSPGTLHQHPVSGTSGGSLWASKPG